MCCLLSRLRLRPGFVVRRWRSLRRPLNVYQPPQNPCHHVWPRLLPTQRREKVHHSLQHVGPKKKKPNDPRNLEPQIETERRSCCPNQLSSHLPPRCYKTLCRKAGVIKPRRRRQLCEPSRTRRCQTSSLSTPKTPHPPLKGVVLFLWLPFMFWQSICCLTTNSTSEQTNQRYLPTIWG